MLKFSVSFLIITRVNGVINGLNPLLNGLGIAAAFGLAKMYVQSIAQLNMLFFDKFAD